MTTALEKPDLDSVYFLCDERGSQHNARRFAAQCADTLDDISPAAEDFIQAFQYLTACVDEPYVVALDDFSYLVDKDDTIPS